MRVVVVSDTHDNLLTIDKLGSYISKKQDIDLILHLGDYVSPFTLKKLLDLNVKLIGIFGNNDGDKISMLKVLGSLGELHEPPLELSVDYLKALMIHGYRSKELTEKLVNSLALSNYYDLIMFGHTHIPKIGKVGNTVILNPGALSGYLTNTPTLAIINTEEFNLLVIDVQSNVVVDSFRIDEFK